MLPSNLTGVPVGVAAGECILLIRLPRGTSNCVQHVFENVLFISCLFQ